MNTNSLRSTPEREKNIAVSLQKCASEIAKAIVENMETCINCAHFHEQTEICELAQARPPARVIAHGCPSYTPGIPF
jgi:hypothetical protein